jgi:hypothetical protein
VVVSIISLSSISSKLLINVINEWPLSDRDIYNYAEKIFPGIFWGRRALGKLGPEPK